MLTSLLNADVREMEENWSAIDRDIYLHLHFPRIYFLKQFFAEGFPRFFHRHVTCKMFDHDIEMDGYAGPDSGAEFWYCKRGCGYSGHHYYY